MDHAAAHERIVDLALEADGLARLETSGAPEDRALLDHVRTCATCRPDVAASRRLSDNLRQALDGAREAGGGQPEAAVQPIAAPDSLRSAILDAARREQAAPEASQGIRPAALARGWTLFGSRAWSPPRWAVGLAAALAIAIIGGLGGMQLQRSAQGPGSESVAEVVASLDHVLAADDHRIVQLRAADGTVAGAVAWSRRDFAVLASSLSTPPAGHVYRCWLQWSGRSASIGVMEFAGDTAYWTGSVGEWAAVAFDPATRFVVTLEPATSGAEPTAPSTPVVLQADLGT
jgi:hypothetical protein